MMAKEACRIAYPPRKMHLAHVCASTHLQSSWLAIGFIYHLQIHVELGRNGSVDQPLDSLLYNSGERGRDVQVAHTDPNLPIVQLLQDLGVHLGKDGRSIGNQEPSPGLHGLGGTLEADEGGVGSRPLGGGLAVEADVMPPKTGLVDFLVQRVALGGKLAQTRGMEGIQAGLESQGMPHGPVAVDVLHEIEAANPDGAMFEKVGTNLLLVLTEILDALGVVLGRRSELEGAVRLLLGNGLRLLNADIV